MRAFTRAAVLIAAAMTVAAGCSMGQLQTARTTAPGDVDVTLGVGYLHNDMVEVRGVNVANVPPHVGMRIGAHERVDIGVRMILLDGLLVDGKVNLVDPHDKLAISASLGLGAGGWVESTGEYVSITMPIHFLISYDVSEVVTPYAGVGYHFWWHLGREVTLSQVPAGSKPAERAGHGDGILALTLGVELRPKGAPAVLLEYDYWAAIVDDPGDVFAMADSHIFLTGLRF